MKTSLPFFNFLVVVAFFVIAGNEANAQTPALEFTSGAGNPTGNGASIANQVITFQNNTNNPSGNTFAAYSPTLTATFSLSNQQYTMPTSQISTGKGLSFGATQNNSGALAPSVALFTQMNSIGSPANNNFTSGSSITAGTGIDINTNKAINIFTSARPLYNASSSTSGRYYYGDLTITFNQPVSNPVLHLVGMGGTYVDLGFTSELELQTANVSLSKLSGSSELTITSGTKILNSAATPGSTTGDGAASGSVLATGSGITTLTFKVYLRGDGHDNSWSGSGNHQGDLWMIGVSLNTPVDITGNVFNDANGLVDNTVNGTGTGLPGSTQVYANLLTSVGKVLSSVAVNSNGSYAFNNVASNTAYTVQISTNQGVMGQLMPATVLPSGWVNTGEYVGTTAGNDGSINSQLAASVAMTDVANINFGIERLPNSDTKWYEITSPVLNSFLYLNNSGLQPGPLSGTDAEDGTLGSTKRVAITSLPTNNNQLWYNGVRITVGTDGTHAPSVTNPYIIASYSPALLSVKFTGVGTYQTSFTYAYYDAAKIMDATPATYTLSWSIPLPVKLTSFTAMLDNNNKALIKWTTLTEVNLNHFIVEKSTDGVTFSQAGLVFAYGNGTDKTDYSLADDISNVQSNVIYYRLRSVDIDGRSEVSETRIIKISKTTGAAISISAYPNPVTTEVRITIPANWQNKKVVYEVFAMNGQVIKSMVSANSNQTESISVSSFAPGLYIVRASCEGQAAQQKIIKN